MRRLVRCLLAAACLPWCGVAADAYPANLLSAKRGARISTESALSGRATLDALLSDGPVSKGRIRFGDRAHCLA